MLRLRFALVPICIGAGVAFAMGAELGRTSSASAPIAVSCSNSATSPTLGGKPLDLTGIYAWPKFGATFYLRQSGTCLYMMGQNGHGPLDPHPVGKGFTTIFVGGISPKLSVSGLWSDVPYGFIGGHGELVWTVSNVGGKLTLTALSSTGGWGAEHLVLTKKVTAQG